MSKMKPMMLAVAFAGCAMLALASIVAIPEEEPVLTTASSSINAFELMSVSKGLPVQRFEAY